MGKKLTVLGMVSRFNNYITGGHRFRTRTRSNKGGFFAEIMSACTMCRTMDAFFV